METGEPGARFQPAVSPVVTDLHLELDFATILHLQTEEQLARD